MKPEMQLDTRSEVLSVLDSAMGLNGRTSTFTDSTRLLGHLPELDSMAVVDILTGLEERLGITVADDEIDGASFNTVGSLVAFVARKLAG
jgi:acyl carrier protein